MRRSVLYVSGYDPVTPEAFFKRLNREIRRFETTWGTTATIAEPVPSADAKVWRAAIETAAAGWRTETDLRFLAWDDIVKADFAQPIWKRVPVSLLVLIDFLLTGTIFRFFFAAWRFALYFLGPYIFSLAFLIVACVVALLVARIPLPGMWLVAIAVGLAVYGLLMKRPGDHWFVSHLLDARTFMGQYVRGLRKDMDARVDRFARELIETIAAGGHDEIVVIGHSQGSVFALEIVERAMALDPARFAARPPLSILTVGSCVPQVGLHPSARHRFRPHVARIKRETDIEWVEVQALSDPVNFYRTDPGKLMRLAPDVDRPFPHVELVRIRSLLQPADYAHVRKSLFRLHYQFVMGNTQRAAYDFFMICCGPDRFTNRIAGRTRKAASDMTAARRGK